MRFFGEESRFADEPRFGDFERLAFRSFFRPRSALLFRFFPASPSAFREPLPFFFRSIAGDELRFGDELFFAGEPGADEAAAGEPGAGDLAAALPFSDAAAGDAGADAAAAGDAGAETSAFWEPAAFDEAALAAAGDRPRSASP